jgi:hypothetical protein
MRTRRSQRIRRGTAEQLLHGGPAPVPDPLARLLASAAAPPWPGELAHEETAVAAFHAARLGPVAAPRGEQMVTPPLARLRTTKIAALALVLCATGGIALAATMSGGSPFGSGPAPGPGRAGASRGGEGRPGPAAAVIRPAQRAAGHLSGLRARGAAGASPGAASPATVPTAGLCLALTADVHAILTARRGPGADGPAGVGPRGSTAVSQPGLSQPGLSQPGLDARDRARALASPALLRILAHPGFPGLTATAGGTANVADLCALTLGVPAPPAPQRLAGLPATALASVPVAALARQPRWVLVRLPALALARLPVPVLATLPRPVLATLPVPALARLPVPVLATLPSAVLGRLPGTMLARLPVPVLRRLPAPALVRLPVSVLVRLPAATLARLPGYVLARLPAPVLRRLPASVRARLAAAGLSRVPAPALAKLPVSVLAQLPAPVLASLPTAVRSLLPAALLVTMPNGL